jgi:hypothetical protein
LFRAKPAIQRLADRDVLAARRFLFQGYRHMHLIQFREIMRDAKVAHSIYPIVLKYHLSVEDTTKALLACSVSRAANVAHIIGGRFLSIDLPSL